MLNAIMASARDYAIIAVNPHGEIATWSAGAECLFGYSEAEIRGQPLDVLFTAADRVKGTLKQEMVIAGKQGRAPDVRMYQRKDRSCFWADGVLQPMLGAGNEVAGYVQILRDATDEHLYDAHIERLARTDPLTGLANRAEFGARFKAMTAAALRHGEWLLVQLIDLDHFKQVNDRYGHHVGDLLLKQVAGRICDAVRETDFVARLGGDEFVVLQSDADMPDAGGTLAEKLLALLAQPYTIEGLDVRIGASIGISVYPQDDTEPEQLLRKADLALYKVKAESRNGYHYFSKDLDDQSYKRSRDVAAVKRAIAKQDFSVVYQPKISTATGEVAAVEALLRCHDRVLSGRSIVEVIQLAVEVGSMEQLGLWVMAQACAQTVKWQQAGLKDLKVCVNLCASEMSDPAFPARVAEILASSGLAPEHLYLEITEREIFDSGQIGQQILVDIRALGVQVALDDFGTGYSSLSYLTDLRVDEIKLDKSFLRNVPESAQDCTVVASILGLARGLHLTVVAEGVETVGQVKFFVRERCDLMQGFFFSPALPPKKMTPWLLERAHVNLLPPSIQSLQPQPVH
jgi:diguanylate cyclase (GGDEF)-like protein/PAS domain S-box-containing protein